MQARGLSYALGAEILDVDLSQPMTDASFSEIHAAFLEYSVLLFRGRRITREQHIAFCARFGEVDKNEIAQKQKIPGYPEILTVSHTPGNESRTYAGKVWHTDQPHRVVPPMATTLRGVEVPDVGGDTLFANMYLAYETLSDGMKKLLDGLYGIHPRPASTSRRYDASTPEKLAETQRLNPPIAQPLVRVHPETGRKALYLTEKVKQIVGMSREESRPLVEFLCRHATRPQFVLRHQWQKDDLIIWDNRCLMHQAANDFDKSQVRYLERTLIKGTPCGYVYEETAS